VASAIFVVPSSATALAQVEITPETSITPSSHVTSWIFQIAIASAILAILVLVLFALSYLRFAPKFFGRAAKTEPASPGARPPTLARQAAALRWTPPAASAAGHGSAAAAPAGPATATAVAERPPPAPAPSPAVAEAATEGPAAAAAAAEAEEAAEPSVSPTAAPSGEPAAQGDAVGEAEAAAPEPTHPAEAPAEVAAPGEAAQAPAPAAPAAVSHGGATLDQETFDRVLEEQLAKGVDRRVAEGRARAAAVVAARKKAQG
jgi:hypothetical protein